MSAPVWWENLISWIHANGGQVSNLIELVETDAGRGLIARQDIPPATKLIEIPKKILLNSATLAPLYPAYFSRDHTGLTATQFLCLHLALQGYRHSRQAAPQPPSPRDYFQPFLSSLPSEFPTLPLEWMLATRSREQLMAEFLICDQNEKETISCEDAHPKRQKNCSELMALLPYGARRRAEDVYNRFKGDYLKTKDIWSKYQAITPTELDCLEFHRFVIAWSNVNTRCVYYDLGNKTSDNLTLAPVIDMINHRFHRTTQPIGSASSLSFTSPEDSSQDGPYRARDAFNDPGSDGRDELVFSYGPHENSMLLTEYGFTLAQNPYNTVDIDRHIKQLFDDDPTGMEKWQLLEETGYAGNMSLDSSSYHSFRVLVALRLLHHHDHRGDESGWIRVVNGDDDIISSRNEAKVEQSIRDIASVVVLESEEGISACEQLDAKWLYTDVDTTLRSGLQMLRGIWETERGIGKSLTSQTRRENLA